MRKFLIKRIRPNQFSVRIANKNELRLESGSQVSLFAKQVIGKTAIVNRLIQIRDQLRLNLYDVQLMRGGIKKNRSMAIRAHNYRYT